MPNIYKAVLIASTLSIAVLFAVGSVDAQFENRVKLADAAKNKSATPTRRASKYTGTRKVETRVVTKVDKVKVSSLSVTTEPGAKVVLEGNGIKPTPIIAGPDGGAIFNDVKPGIYRLMASKEEFETVEADKVVISPQKAHVLDMDLKQITYKLKLKTNLNGGEVQFRQLKASGRGSDGKVQTEQSGNYCVVRIQPTGEAVINDLKKGDYDVDILPESLEYAAKGASISVPEDLTQDEFQLEIEKDISKEEFTSAWIKSEWKVPSSWKIDNGLKARSDGIGLPANVRYLQYVDFEMIANIKLNDKGTVGLVLRAKSEKNYYLLQISGERGVDPLKATLRLVVEGVPQPDTLASAPIPHFAKALASDKGFKLTVQGSGKSFTVWIEDSETGKGGPVGQLTDQYNTYKKGAVGVAGAAKTDFDVSFFRVCPTKCK